jgi:hypothetical protein
MRVLAIDPGPTMSGWVVIDTDAGLEPLEFGKAENEELLHQIGLGSFMYDRAVIEMIASYGMSVGAEVFETCVWIGRFYERARHFSDMRPTLTVRKEVKLHHCGTTKANDSNIAQALIDRFALGQPNRGKGTKLAPGFFYGFKSDIWAAFALAVQYADTQVLGVHRTVPSV